MKQFAFKKSDRLTSQRIIGDLFSSGKTFFLHPFRIYWSRDHSEHGGIIQVAISVPKKRIKRAVDRNRIKRKIREAYRIHQGLLRDHVPPGAGLSILLVYATEKEVAFSVIEEKLVLALKQLRSAYEEST
jgi:ribonuclease P protein component